MKKRIERERLTGERALFCAEELYITDTIFDDGESPLKESKHIELENSFFRWKYPLWYAEDIKVNNCVLFDGARAGIWYSKDVEFLNTPIEAPKSFRRCDGLKLANVSLPNALETLWHCKNVELQDVTAKGDYFAMNSENMDIKFLTLHGNYSFDGVRNVTVERSKLLTKDAFWNSENVTVRKSYITGEYLGWNAKNLTLEDCVIESLQGLCYIDNLVMRNCKPINTTLAFEYSSVDVELDGHVDSIFNPKSGRIECDSVGELIIEKDRIDPEKTIIKIKESENV